MILVSSYAEATVTSTWTNPGCTASLKGSSDTANVLGLRKALVIAAGRFTNITVWRGTAAPGPDTRTNDSRPQIHSRTLHRLKNEILPNDRSWINNSCMRWPNTVPPLRSDVVPRKSAIISEVAIGHALPRPVQE